ncbi:MAG: hypothetical protein K2Q22_08895 [Cytophagales bacterium]|nr:hypothetical protein [Cytophagales bacterium]
MKQFLLLHTFLLSLLLTTFNANAQSRKPYWTSGSEVILSFANINSNGKDFSSVGRFSAFYHLEANYHLDANDNIGIFSGVTLRNVGFIYDQNDSIRKKFRTYNLGVPIALKMGQMNGVYVFGGYEFEIPFNFKEKTFTNESDKTKYNEWFSKRNETIQQSFFIGIRLPYGSAIKFKYYLTPFFNKDFTTTDADGNEIKPYENLKVNLFYVSLSTMMQRGKNKTATSPYY